MPFHLDVLVPEMRERLTGRQVEHPQSRALAIVPEVAQPRAVRRPGDLLRQLALRVVAEQDVEIELTRIEDRCEQGQHRERDGQGGGQGALLAVEDTHGGVLPWERWARTAVARRD